MEKRFYKYLCSFGGMEGTDVGKALPESRKKPISLDLVSPYEIKRLL